MFPPNIVEDALEAEKLWAEYCGTDNAPSNTQMRTWIRSCGMPALRHAIPLAGWKKRKCAEEGQPIPPEGLERYTSAACKRKSLELGFVRPEQTQPKCGPGQCDVRYTLASNAAATYCNAMKQATVFIISACNSFAVSVDDATLLRC
jgi:hypothetical protein